MRFLLLSAVLVWGCTAAFAGNGDVNGDGYVRLSDAVQAARLMANPLSGSAFQRGRADVLPLTSTTGDGRITLGDVRYILRVVAGLERNPDWIEVPLYAVKVSDDDGGRACSITPEQVQAWVDYTNTAYSVAGVHVTFDPVNDFKTVKSTLLNNMTGVGDANWELERQLGNELAALRPGHITVYFRHGPGVNATGGGFSWWDYNFVAMPGYWDTGVCGHQNAGLLAHEMGHYLGLKHTFAAEFVTIADANSYFLAHNKDASAFNGDDFSDTVPDPYIQEIQCNRQTSVLLSGVVVPICRDNLMSYYEAPARTLTPQQCERLRWMVRTRARNAMAMPDNGKANVSLQGEDVGVWGYAGEAPVVQDMSYWGASRWSGGRQLFCRVLPEGWVLTRVWRDKAEKVSMSFWFTQAPDYSIVQVFLNDKPIGEAFDGWAPEVMPSGRINLGVFDMKAGWNYIKYQSVGKNPLSSNYYIGLDAMALVPVG